jgi:hypothetical protein
MSVKIIRPIALTADETDPFEYSLKIKKRTRIPGAGVYVSPVVDDALRTLTGLDEDATKIRLISSPEAREKEQKALKELRERLQDRTGFDLTATRTGNLAASLSNSPYYREVEENGGFRLTDGDNVFDMSKAIDVINFKWLCETTIIAKSLDDAKSGKYYPGTVLFYVYEEDAEAKQTYQRVQKQDAAFVLLSQLSPQKRRQVGRLMGLGLPDTAIDEVVYTKIRDYISLPATSTAKDPLNVFNKWAQLSDEMIDIEHLVRELLDKRIIRLYGDTVKQGETTLAKSLEAFKNNLLDPGNQEELESLKDKLKNSTLASVIM